MTKNERETLIAKIETAKLLIEMETDKRELDYHIMGLLEDLADGLAVAEPQRGFAARKIQAAHS